MSRLNEGNNKPTDSNLVKQRYEKVKEFLYAAEDFDEDRKEGLKNLFEYLEKLEWDQAYCSTRYHGNYEGGLLDHSINVANLMLKLHNTLCPDLSAASAVLVGLLHDCGKVRMYYRQPATPRQEQFGYLGTIVVDAEQPYYAHEQKSLQIISRFIKLTTEEWTAIATHNEPWLTNTCQFQRAPLMTLLQYADYWACLYMDATV